MQLELPEFEPKNLAEWAEEFAEFLLLTGQSHMVLASKCSLLKRSCKRKFSAEMGQADCASMFNMGQGAPKTGENLPGL